MADDLVDDLFEEGGKPVAKAGGRKPVNGHHPEAKAPRAALVACPIDFKPNDRAADHAAKLGVDLDTCIRGFVVHFTEGKGRNEKRPGWDRSFMVWCDNEAKRYGGRRVNGNPAPVRDFDRERADARRREIAEILKDEK